MEFMDITLLSGEEKTGLRTLDFKDLRNLPKVQVSMDMEMIHTKENEERLHHTIIQGSSVANISKVNLNAMDECDDSFHHRILFEMTSICNVLCKMCPRNHLLRPAMHMDTKTYLCTLDEINEYGVEGLWLFHLGESLLHPDFRKIVRYLDNLDKLGYIWMSTNGHLMNESNIKFILDSRIDYINYSLHGVSAEAHKSVIPQGNFERVLSNYETLIRLRGRVNTRRPVKPYIHLQMIEQEETRHETTAFIDIHKSEVEVVSVNMLEYVNLPGNEFGMVQRQRPGKGHCKRVRKGDCFICSNGAVTLCDAAYNCSHDSDDMLYLGNIHESSLAHIWNGDKRKRILDLEKSGDLCKNKLCAECTDYDF